MTIVDANVLVYAADETAPWHERSRRWLDQALRGPGVVGFAWMVVLAYLRISTNAKVFTEPLTFEEAAADLAGWLAQPAAVLVEPTPTHLSIVTSLLREAGMAGNLVNDAHLAALAIEHDAEVISFDGDFDRFTGVSWSMPPVSTDSGH